tara:strand:+ start:3954 stop:4526 length:573 start_codon:yes stop_codon:yes gene_type:complete
MVSRRADLSPPLGHPIEAGPCYIVNRIYDKVRNPKLRDQLVKEIEEGGKDFDGRDERKVYQIHKERALNGKAMVLLPHVQRRMDERGIPVTELRVALKHWEKWYHREKSMQSFHAKKVQQNMAYGDKIVWEDPKIKITVVFKRDKDGNYLVVTTFPSDHYMKPKPTSCPLPTSVVSHIRNLSRSLREVPL